MKFQILLLFLSFASMKWLKYIRRALCAGGTIKMAIIMWYEVSNSASILASASMKWFIYIRRALCVGGSIKMAITMWYEVSNLSSYFCQHEING